ncbi:hypothetical protein ABC955_09250 [Citromicrobium bathyomarinum]
MGDDRDVGLHLAQQDGERILEREGVRFGMARADRAIFDPDG